MLYSRLIRKTKGILERKDAPFKKIPFWSTTKIFMKKTLILGIVLSFFAFLFVAVPVSADSVCQPIYGGGEQCSNTQWYINKMVLNPSTNVYVDNLTLSDPKFKPGQMVQFRIQVTNTGTATLGVIKVTDTLPNYIDLDTVQGPTSVDKATGKVTFEVNSLNAGQSKEAFISAKVKGAGAFPAAKNTLCPVNHVEAQTANVGNVSDTAQFCIQKESTAPTAVPKTGASEVVLLGLAGILPAGMYLLRKSKLK